jgi:hypothetical protein
MLLEEQSIAWIDWGTGGIHSLIDCDCIALIVIALIDCVALIVIVLQVSVANLLHKCESGNWPKHQSGICVALHQNVVSMYIYICIRIRIHVPDLPNHHPVSSAQSGAFAHKFQKRHAWRSAFRSMKGSSGSGTGGTGDKHNANRGGTNRSKLLWLLMMTVIC